MRRVLIPGVAVGFATMACAAAARPGAPAQAPARAAQSGQGAMVSASNRTSASGSMSISAFSAEYRIEQGSAVRTGSFARDLIAEERAGRISSPHPGQAAPYAIAMDIRARADLLIAQMT